ncbi:diguanylate cyclase [Carboxydothermus pertinax]|uniref:GGDEF domain-containing protein n=1 Tax=Carboxydothermus pertinax TaxID=870242 RepID=A0A1L8CV81_9THEO|nr:diguanylate cyclase [Carboxydothermus pertinax]GAV22812.1 hypothetical protein cpu_13220 [Carboxydothermus pertinax]
MTESLRGKQIVIILSIVLIFSLLEWANAHRVYSKIFRDKVTLEQKQVETQINVLEQAQTEKIFLALRTLASDQTFCQLLKEKKREGLSRYLTASFLNWQNMGIDNIGVLDSGKKVILRLATPGLSGDNVKNFINLKGVPGEYEAKLVFGPLGYRFRVVIPVFYQNKLVGYLMGGMFWERIINEINDTAPNFGIVAFLENNQLKKLGFTPDMIQGKFINLGGSSLIAQNRDYPLEFLKELSRFSRSFPPAGIYKIAGSNYYLSVKKGSSGERIVFLTPVAENLKTFYGEIGVMSLLVVLELLVIGSIFAYFNREILKRENLVTAYLKQLNQKGLDKPFPENFQELGDCSVELKKFIKNTEELITSLTAEVELNRLLKNEKEEEGIYKILKNFLERKYKITDTAILILNESQNRLEIKALSGEVHCNPQILEDKEVCAVIARGRKVVKFPGSLDRCPEYRGSGFYACIPLIVGGEVKGVIHVTCATGEQEKLKRIERLVEIAVPYLYNARLLKALEYSSMIDELTKVYNRRFLVNFLEKEIAFCRRHGSQLGLILLDLDNFKHINDVYGHLMGDEVLKKVGEILRSTVRNQDVVARYGGEEFCVVLPAAGWQGSYEVAAKLKSAINELKFSEPGISVTASIGVTVFPEEAKNLEELLGVADKLLYLAKNAGKNRVVTLKDLDLPNS